MSVAILIFLSCGITSATKVAPPATTPQLVQVDGPPVEVEHFFFVIDVQDTVADVHTALLIKSQKSGKITFEWRTPRAENVETMPFPIDENSRVIVEIPEDTQKKAMLLIDYTAKLESMKPESTRRFLKGYRLDVLQPIRNGPPPEKVLGYVNIPNDWKFSGENWSVFPKFGEDEENKKVYILTSPSGIPASWEVFPNE